MKRPIKFRGRTCGGYDEHGNAVPPKTVYGEGVYSDMYGTVIYHRANAREGIQAISVDKDSVAQFVGYDKDGKEVYEGDEIVNTKDTTCVAELLPVFSKDFGVTHMYSVMNNDCTLKEDSN